MYGALLRHEFLEFWSIRTRTHKYQHVFGKLTIYNNNILV